MFVGKSEYNGNPMIVIKKDEVQDYALFQGGMRKFIPIVQALTENTEEVLAVLDSIGGDAGAKVAAAFRTNFNIPSLTANPPAPTKKPKVKKEKA